MNMTAYAPAKTDDEISEAVTAGVDEIREEGKRSAYKKNKLDITDPRVIGKEVVVALARKISPDDIADLVDRLIRTTRPTKFGAVPDARAMEAGIKLYLAYCIGLPTQRQEIVQVNLDADSSIGLAERLANSPALLKSLEQIISKVKESQGATVSE